MRRVVVITAADGTVSVAGAFRDIARADDFAARVEQLGDGLETAIVKLEEPARVLKELRS